MTVISVHFQKELCIFLSGSTEEIQRTIVIHALKIVKSTGGKANNKMDLLT